MNCIRISEEPKIARCLKTGYPDRPFFVRCCPLCEYELGDCLYYIDEEGVCETCFLEWAADFLKSNPKEAAKALRVNWEAV